jgi:predicted transposase/invertase (TIGR01784 family)
MKSQPLLDPKNDYVFKRLFTLEPTILIDLINVVRYDAARICQIEILNPHITAEELDGKFIILDLLAADEHGSRYNIEMQVRKVAEWSARSSYYLARTLSQQIANGDEYRELKPAVGIHLLNFNLFTEEPGQAVWYFQMRDRTRPEITLGDELQLHLIELPKADRLSQIQSQELRAWISFFEHSGEEETMNSVNYAPVETAMARLRQLSADDEVKRLAFVRERAQRDEASIVNAARREGEEIGKEIGRKEGEEIGRKEGKEIGRKEGKEIGRKEGEERGIKLGEEQGRNKALAEIYAKLIAAGNSEEEALSILGLDKKP